MNNRIRKKKEQQRLAWTVRELVAEPQQDEERKQSVIGRFVNAYGGYYEQQQAQMGV